LDNLSHSILETSLNRCCADEAALLICAHFFFLIRDKNVRNCFSKPANSLQVTQFSKKFFVEQAMKMIMGMDFQQISFSPFILAGK
jgi:hypothetical protein